jgi:hypothetical protein
MMGEPGCVVPSMVTGCVMVGSGDVGKIVLTPDPGMLKAMVDAPAMVLLVVIADLSEPAPLSLVLVTVVVVLGLHLPAMPALKIA